MSEYEEVIVRLDKANTIIEEIVRCKDCRWYRDYDGCFFSTAEVEPLGYCSYGERKTEEESIREVARGFLELVDATTDRKTENSSEKPNNCEHITEDGVTCAKYPACDDCLDNPLNKVKGSERLVKGKDEPTISKMEQVGKE